MAEEEGTILEELLPNEIKAIETEIRNEIRKEQHKQKREDLKKSLRKKIRQEKGIDETIESVTIDLAKHSDRITIDGTAYLQGITYEVKESLARELRWIMQSTFDHQDEIDGKPRRYSRRQENAVMSPRGIVTTSGVLRA